MAHIFKHPNSLGKGIIVLTHKEMNHYLAHNNLDIFRRTRNILKRSKNDLFKLTFNPRYFEPLLKNIQKKYYIGVHFGSHMEKVNYHGHADFYMVADGSLNKQKDSVLKFNLISRNFIPPSFYRDLTTTKYWDIICVARAIIVKRLDKFLISIRKCYDLGHKFRVLLVIPSGEIETSKHYYTELLNDYYKMFNYEERELFTVIKLSSQMAFPGISSSTISHLYRRSRIFTLFTDVEGGSKVLTEAQLCGLKVVVYKNLKGGGLNPLRPSNSFLFESYETAHEKLIEAVANSEMSEAVYQDIYDRLNFTASIKELKEHFNVLYQQDKAEFDGELINLDRLYQRLPAHTNDDVPWAQIGNHTADAYSIKSFHDFISYLKLD